MEELSIPVKAHQQPLLRRPRPPKTCAQISNGLTREADDTAPGKSPRTGRTPKSSVCPKAPPNSSSHAVDRNSKSDFQIYCLYPRGPDYFPPGGKLLAVHVPYAPNDVAIAANAAQVTNHDIITEVEPTSTHCRETSDSDHASAVRGQAMDNVHTESQSLTNYYTEDDDNFTLNDFQRAAELSRQRRVSCEKGGKFVSRQNYHKFTGWFAANIPIQEKLNTVTLTFDSQSPEEFKPRLQAILELRSMVNEALTPPPAEPNMEASSTKDDNCSVCSDQIAGVDDTGQDLVLIGSTSRYFCGQGRSSSPFDYTDQPYISPSEEAILDSMTRGGEYLSLKAHFISELPDILPLAKALTYLNISFNCFNIFPPELLQLPHLVCLKMRNNPIRIIPNEIRCLTKLQVLCISFNLLTDLPAGMFELSCLCDLDVSFNSLHTISRSVYKLTHLRRLNVDGNQLAGLPSTITALPLTHLLVGGNLMHPIFWSENTMNQLQDLVDLCSLVVKNCVVREDDPRLSMQIVKLLRRYSPHCCDSCGCSVYGSGQRVIRAIRQDVLGIKNLPFIFQVCSTSCRKILKNKPSSDWNQPFGATVSSGSSRHN